MFDISILAFHLTFTVYIIPKHLKSQIMNNYHVHKMELKSNKEITVGGCVGE